MDRPLGFCILCMVFLTTIVMFVDGIGGWFDIYSLQDFCTHTLVFSWMQLFGGQRIYRCTMTHNIKPHPIIFLEAEYDAHMLKVYWEARVITTRLKNNEYSFSCMFCKEIHKDKKHEILP